MSELIKCPRCGTEGCPLIHYLSRNLHAGQEDYPFDNRVSADIACSLRAIIHEFRKWNEDIE